MKRCVPEYRTVGELGYSSIDHRQPHGFALTGASTSLTLLSVFICVKSAISKSASIKIIYNDREDTVQAHNWLSSG